MGGSSKLTASMNMSTRPTRAVSPHHPIIQQRALTANINSGMFQ
jgi:hypothetical protein